MQALWLLSIEAAEGGGPLPPVELRQLLELLELREPRAAAGSTPWLSLDGRLARLYLPERVALPAPSSAGITRTWRRLEGMQRLDGASAGEPVAWHYVVETEVLPQHEDDFNAWYAEEHLPGLAAVPGTLCAARYRDDAHPPRYHACYDLAHPRVLESPAWLAVRGTAWSSRVRPTFRNTRRTMFRTAGSG